MLGRLRGRGAADGFAATASTIAQELNAVSEWGDAPLKDSQTARALLDDPREQQVRTLLDAMTFGAQRKAVALRGEQQDWKVAQAAGDLAKALLRRKLPWADDTLAALLDCLIAQGDRWDRHELRAGGYGEPVLGVLRAVEQTLGARPPPAPIEQRLKQVRDALLRSGYADAENRRAARRVDALLRAEGGGGPLTVTDDPWAQALLAQVDALDGGQPDLVRRLLVLAQTATGSKPTKSFGAERDRLLVEHGREAVGARAGALLSAASAARPTERFEVPPAETGNVLRGVAWIAGAGRGEVAARGLADLAVAGWKKVPNFGPLSQKAANAALGALADLPEGAPQLGRVRSQLKQANAVSAAGAAVERAAERLGIDRSEFEERVVPDFGLDAQGERSVELGDYVAELRLLYDLSTELRFRNAAGRTIKSAPAAVRAEYPDEVAALRQQVKDIKAMAGAQRLRLERLLLDDRAWTAEQWRARYRHHGLVGVLARRLIWIVETPDGPISVLPLGGGLVDQKGLPVNEPAGAATVRFWHPATAPPEEVRAWRVLLEGREVCQPFKQAHREVYLLTGTERQTATYSNRFAAHILRQHQMAALAHGRGWRYALQGAWDSPDEEAVLELPGHDLSVAFWLERPWNTEEWNDSGVFTFVLSDQVRFRDSAGDPVRLDTLPPRVFSEAMRDVDLFVGVTSIGNDPTWIDAGNDDRRFREYWNDFAFGELTEQADVRRDLLERLLPKLAIADRAEIHGRFLRVRGRLRTYKIHLGSGNILMEPNDQYLCIVPGRGKNTHAAARVFLPFEGDQVLSIILSKALLLARDDRIEDQTITSQIGSGP